jgi:hypothetical protein
MHTCPFIQKHHRNYAETTETTQATAVGGCREGGGRVELVVGKGWDLWLSLMRGPNANKRRMLADAEKPQTCPNYVLSLHGSASPCPFASSGWD